jgi:hypothetical protein
MVSDDGNKTGSHACLFSFRKVFLSCAAFLLREGGRIGEKRHKEEKLAISLK